MTSRLAYMREAMFVVTAKGVSLREHGAEELSAYLRGCIVQYA